MSSQHPFTSVRRAVGTALVLSLLAAPSLIAQNSGPGFWIQPHVGVTERNHSLDVLGLGLHVNLSPALAAVGAVDRWKFGTGCPAEVPSTCGDDGWGFAVGLRIAAFLDGVVVPFVEPQVGLYRFSDGAREGHTTSSIGGRAGVAFSPGNVFRWEIAAKVRHMNGYDRGALQYPGLRFSAAQLAVGIPIA